MDEFTRLKQLADDYAATMAAFTSSRHDTDDLIRKAVMITDGKVVDKNSLVTLTVTA